MKKQIQILLIAVLCVTCFLFFSETKAETEVSGIISTSTVWVLENSPYIITGNILVEEGVTLTIEPGVTVKFNENPVSGGGYYMKIDGTLVAKGMENNKIIFTSNSPRDWGGIRFSEKSIGWDEETSTGSIIKNSVIGHVKYERVHSNYLITISAGAFPLIANNTLRFNNLALVSDGSSKIIYNKIYDGDIVISGSSYFSENEIIGGGLHVSGLSEIIKNNIIGSKYNGITVSSGSPVITYNNIINSSIDGIVISRCGMWSWEECSPVINNNNIFNNERFAIFLHNNSADINALNNWWGTTTTSSIDDLIYDHKNDYNLGIVNYQPFLTEPESEVPPINTTPPSNPEVIYPEIECGYGYINIEWTNPTDEDFDKTKVYRSAQSDSLGDLIYEGKETRLWEWFWHEIDQTYYYTITAVDFWGNESSGTQFEILIPFCEEEEIISPPRPSGPSQHPWPPTGGGIDYHILTLEPGWNIVSTPRVLLNHEFSVPGTVDNFDIYVLDPTTPTGWNTVEGIGQDEFTPLYAYFVNNKTGEDQTLRFNYDFDLTPAQRLFQRTLEPGWNVVGIALPEETLYWARENKSSSDVIDNLSLINESIIAWIDFTANQGNINSLKISDEWKIGTKLHSNDLDILSSFKGYGVFIKEKTDNYIGFQDITDFSVKEIQVKGENNKTAVGEGQSLQMIAEVFPRNSSDKSVTWSVVNDAGEASINENGLLVGISEGVVTVIATANDGSGTEGILEINVTPPQPGAEIEVKNNPNSPAEGIALIDRDIATDHEVFKFDVKVTRDNIEIRQMEVTMVGTDNINTVRLLAGNEVVASEAASTTVTFDDLRIGVAKDSTKTFTVEVQYAATNTIGNTTISIDGGAGTSPAGITALSASGESTSYTGSAAGNRIHFYQIVPELTLVSATRSLVADTTDKANAELQFRIDARGGDIFVNATPTIKDGIEATSGAVSTEYDIDEAGMTKTPAGFYRVTHGSPRTFTVSGYMDNAGGTAGFKTFYFSKFTWAIIDGGTTTDWTDANWMVEKIRTTPIYLSL